MAGPAARPCVFGRSVCGSACVPRCGGRLRRPAPSPTPGRRGFGAPGRLVARLERAEPLEPPARTAGWALQKCKTVSVTEPTVTVTGTVMSPRAGTH